MAFVMRIAGPGFTAEKYEEVVRRLEAAGEGAPTGRLFHVCFGDRENLRVSDVWDTRENFDRFFAVVGRIMGELGVPRTDPEFIEVLNYIPGDITESAAA
jgi:hypothetical protein